VSNTDKGTLFVFVGAPLGIALLFALGEISRPLAAVVFIAFVVWSLTSMRGK